MGRGAKCVQFEPGVYSKNKNQAASKAVEQVLHTENSLSLRQFFSSHVIFLVIFGVGDIKLGSHSRILEKVSGILWFLIHTTAFSRTVLTWKLLLKYDRKIKNE